MTAPARAALLALALLAAGCASAGKPLTVVVAEKDHRVRLDETPVGLATIPAEIGRDRVVERRRLEPVHEFWIKDTDGKWHRISQSAWESARIGAPLEITPALPTR